MKQPGANIEDRVKKAILKLDSVKHNFRPEDITRETPLIGKGLGLDSVSIFNLVVNLAEQFNISFDESDLSIEMFESFGSLVDSISKKL